MKQSLFKQQDLTTNSAIDQCTNDALGNVFGFLETVTSLEQRGVITFTLEMDRDGELADLLRLCLHDYIQEKPDIVFTEYAAEWLEIRDNLLHTPLEIVEVCPNCGREIHLHLNEPRQKIPFCPYCGQKDVWLCSECMDYHGDCDGRGFCKGQIRGVK